MNGLPYLWVTLLLLCISACTRTEQSAAPEADQTQDLPPAVPLSPAESPFPPTDPPQPPLVTPFNSDQAKALQKAWADHLGTPVQIANPLGIKFNLIPPGEFAMGSLDSEPGRWGDETQHLVKITKPFYLSVHEVTQQQYKKVMDKNPSAFSALGKFKDHVSGIDTSRFPVERVKWNDAVEFCRKLSDHEEVGYRLPTEAEWEYACRAGTTTAYSFGDDTSRLGEYAWYVANSQRKSHPVGKLKPNAWGLYDMHGNVWEWCQDGYAPYGNLAVVSDPTGPALGKWKYHVLRGGGFNPRPMSVRTANRGCILSPPAYGSHSRGFRLARTYNVSP